ncbi:MAG: hypothetical protein ACKVT0_09710 [Planctomycetaceae bacterium]
MQATSLGSWYRLLILWGGTVGIFAGCGTPEDAGPPMGDVSGTITYQDKPVVGASVVFLPTKKDTRAAVAITDAFGYYNLATSGELSGANVGSYQVSIVCRAPYDGPVPEGVSPAYAKELFQNDGKPLIPEKYFSPTTSGLTADVQPGHNALDFILKD